MIIPFDIFTNDIDGSGGLKVVREIIIKVLEGNTNCSLIDD